MNMRKEAVQKRILFSGLRKQPVALACKFPPKGTQILPFLSMQAPTSSNHTSSPDVKEPRAPETGERGQAYMDFS